MDKNKIIIAVMIVLLVVSIVQAFQINEIKQNSIGVNPASFGSSALGNSAANTKTSTPTMVGGC